MPQVKVLQQKMCGSVAEFLESIEIYRADIQRRGSILAWIVNLSVYGVDTIAIDLSLSALIS